MKVEGRGNPGLLKFEEGREDEGGRIAWDMGQQQCFKVLLAAVVCSAGVNRSSWL